MSAATQAEASWKVHLWHSPSNGALCGRQDAKKFTGVFSEATCQLCRTLYRQKSNVAHKPRPNRFDDANSRRARAAAFRAGKTPVTPYCLLCGKSQHDGDCRSVGHPQPGTFDWQNQ